MRKDVIEKLSALIIAAFGLVAALSLIAILIGGLLLSEATMGVGIIAIGGVLAVFARLVQASEYHKETKKLMGDSESGSEKPWLEPGRGTDYLENPPSKEDLQQQLDKMRKEKEA